jgi:hypothetical protein
MFWIDTSVHLPCESKSYPYFSFDITFFQGCLALIFFSRSQQARSYILSNKIYAMENAVTLVSKSILEFYANQFTSNYHWFRKSKLHYEW